MSFEAPIQRIPARRDRAIGVLVAIVVLATLLVWMPWGRPGGTSNSPAGAVIAEATTATNTPARTRAPAPVPSASPTPYLPPAGAPQRTSLPFVTSPTLDLFRPRWSVVGILAEADTPLDVTQIPIVTSSGYIEGTPAEAICRVGVFGSSLVGVLPAHTMRMIGIAAPAGAITSAIELTRVDGTVISAYELLVPPPPDGSTPRASARVFVQSSLDQWQAGTYRFHLEAADGSPRFAYLCLVPPSLLDGTDFGQTGP